VLRVEVDDAELARRDADDVDLSEYQHGMGRELFEVFRANAGGAEQGAMTYLQPPHPRSQTQNERDRIHDHFALDVR
jgi:phosphogluconate dehydratase